MPKKISKKASILKILLRHHAMLSDPLRTPLLLKAVSRTVRPGDVVLDLGCGTGILSFAAAKAGAKKVYACDIDDAIHFARAEAKKLGFDDRIRFHRTLSFDLNILHKPVDVIIAETVGGLGFDENIVPSVYDARKRFLKNNGKIIPHRLKVFLAPVDQIPPVITPSLNPSPLPSTSLRTGGGEGKGRGGHLRGGWGDLTPLIFTKIKPSDLLAFPKIYREVNFHTVQAFGFDHELKFCSKKDGTLRGFAGWFEVEWAHKLVTNTAPNRPLTHWKQALLPISQPVRIKKGDLIFFRLRIYPKGGLYSTTSAIEWGYFVTKQNSP